MQVSLGQVTHFKLEACSQGGYMHYLHDISGRNLKLLFRMHLWKACDLCARIRGSSPQIWVLIECVEGSVCWLADCCNGAGRCGRIQCSSHHQNCDAAQQHGGPGQQEDRSVHATSQEV